MGAIELIDRDEDVVTTTTPNPATLVALAVQQGADIDKLERLMAMQERWEANEARKAYTAAMAAFKKEPPTITKDKHVSFDTKAGRTEYDHATIGNVVRSIVAGLSAHDFSHAWGTEHVDGGRVRVTCKLTHKLGHSESVSLEAARDESGGKNSIQALGSAITYLQRYTLLAITGLATEEQDDDGGASGVPKELLRDLLIEVRKTKTDEEALKFWNEHKRELADDPAAFRDFKDETLAHRRELKEATA